MIINNVQFNASLEQIMDEVIAQSSLNGFMYFQKGYRESGNDLMVQCPYHGDGQERKPSAGIRKSDGQFHCFACGEIHSLHEVISHCFGHDDIMGKWGWKWLLKNFATVQVEERKDVSLDIYRDSKYNSTANSASYVTEEELDRYRYYHPYWERRGIVDDNIIELFDLGYDKEQRAITFPVRDVRGNCLFIARRSVVSKFFNYPRGVEKPLYGLYEWKQSNIKSDEAIITESMLDTLSFWQIGKLAFALNGTGNQLQFKQLRELSCRKLILATDNDKAGQKARHNIRQNVKNKIITEYIFPQGRKDANECTKEELLNLEEVF